MLDVNADRLPDFVHALWMTSPFTLSSGCWLNTGNGWGPKVSSWTPPAYLFVVLPDIGQQVDRGVRFSDLNGDGLPDTIQGYFQSVGSLRFGWVNDGRAWAAQWWGAQNEWAPPSGGAYFTKEAPGVGSEDAGLRLADINSDGLADLLLYRKVPGSFRVWLNKGYGSIRSSAWLEQNLAPSVSSIAGSGFLEYADFNGDGTMDVVALSTNPDSNRIYLGQTAPFNMLTAVNNGLGGITQVSYGLSPPSLESVRLPPVVTVRSLAVSDGMSGTAIMTSSYSYAGGRFDAQRPNREFLGFQRITQTDVEGNYTVTSYFQDEGAINGINLYKGKLSEQARYDAAGNLLTKSTYTVSYSTPFAGVYFPFIAQVDTHIDSKHSAVGYVYDSSGNVRQQLNYGDLSVVGDERTIATAYSTSSGPYLVGLPTVKQTFSGLGTTGTLLARTSFYYDSAYSQTPDFGTLTKVVNYFAGGDDPVVISSYDAYGNLTDTYDALYNATEGMQGNHVQLTYDTTFYQYPRLIQQGVGSGLNLPPETYTYDSATGQLSSQGDMNGSTTTYAYDVFGRLSSVVSPADQINPSSPTVTYQYNLSSSPPHSVVANMRVVHGATMTLATFEFFDGLGRKLQTKTAGPTGRQIVSDAVLFNTLGQVATSYMSVTHPASSSYIAFSSTHPHATIAYDGLGRVVRMTNPDNEASTRAYAGWTETVTDANGNSKVYVRDAYGQIIEVGELYGAATFITTYQYDLLGNLTNIVNSLGQGTTIHYDTLSRRTELLDPQMGAWQYEYDPNGNLLQQTDAKNQVISMTYDALGRRTFRIYPDSSTISFSYDSGSFAKGKLSEVVDLAGAHQFIYDIEGNILAKHRTFEGTVYVTSMTYDALGRETSVIYPDQFTVNEVYDAAALSIVASASTAYATLSYSTSVPSKLGRVLYSNGMDVQYSYDPNMFRLINRKALAAGTTIQSFGYQYDNVGNITEIADTVGPMTQAFSYDSLNRVSQASGTYGTRDYYYDSIGNLTQNPDSAGGAWNFADASQVVSLQGLVVSSSGRIGNGLDFDGASQGAIIGSSISFTPATLTVSMWARPKALGTGYIVSRGGSYHFPRIESNGNISAKLELSSGQQIMTVSSGALLNLWRYYVLTYDGANIKIYVNGQLWASQSATGSIRSSTQSVLLGDGLRGSIDELNIYPWALTAEEVLQRYELYPGLAINEPFAPDSVPTGMTAGVAGTTYTFSFTAWDLNGNDLKYRIDWGTGSYQETAYVPSGTTVQSTHVWSSTGIYSVRLQAVEPSTISAWSPNYNLLIVGTSIQAGLAQPILIGASANVSKLAGSARLSSTTVGETLTGLSSSTLTTGMLGYQGDTIAPSASVPQHLGPQASGGVDAPPTPDLTASDLVNLSYSTSAVDVSTIALNLLEHGATTFIDANGNIRVANGRWILYDYENRPIRVVTQDGTLSQFGYDFEGARMMQSITRLNQSSQTVIYVGGLYEKAGSSVTKYVTAGALRVAAIDSSGAITYFLPDHQGGTNLLVNNGLATVRTVRYMPFGGTYQTSGSVDDDHKYTGQRLDDATRLYYYGARYYDPTSGSFLTPDAIVQSSYDPQTLNRYTYVRNNPLLFTDPTGSFFGEIGDFFSRIAKQTIARPEGFIFFGAQGLIPQVNDFSYRNRYYIATAYLIAGTFGAATPAIAGAGTIGQAAAHGALIGEVAGAAGGWGGNGEAVFLGALKQGALGGASAGLMHGISAGLPLSVNGDFSVVNAAGQIGLKGTVGGLVSEAQGGDFLTGFGYGSAFAAADVGYQGFVGHSAVGAPGAELPVNPYEPHFPSGRPQPAYSNVFGHNRSIGPGCIQGSLCSRFFNGVPGANATATFHDTWLNRAYVRNAVPGLVNRLTMVPSLGAAGASLLGSDWSIVLHHFPGAQR